MKVYFYTLGCKVNQYESQSLSEKMKQEGFEIVQSDNDANIIVVNSCTVTSESDRKTRQAVRRFKKNNPDCCVVLTGCMTQANPDVAINLPQADIVLGNNSNELIFQSIDNYFKTKTQSINVISHCSGASYKGYTISKFDERERAFIKIEDGCDRFCSYCIIPYARGRVRSKPLDEIEKEIKAVAQNSYKEIVLVGINLSAYGKDNGKKITDAIRIANSTDGIERVRLGSLEPDHITDDIIEELKSFDKFCPQFHLSLQSGCDNTLKRMNRHYSAKEYENLCNKLRSSFSETTITTDVMVGFPLESEDDFRESVEFCKKIGFEKVHVFPYSVRQGTKAAQMKQIEKSEKEHRARIMIEETNTIRENFFKEQIGKTVEILIESAKIGDYNIGHTKNYIPVSVKCDKNHIAKTAQVKIESCDKDFCYGSLL